MALLTLKRKKGGPCQAASMLYSAQRYQAPNWSGSVFVSGQSTQVNRGRQPEFPTPEVALEHHYKVPDVGGNPVTDWALALENSCTKAFETSCAISFQWKAGVCMRSSIEVRYAYRLRPLSQASSEDQVRQLENRRRRLRDNTRYYASEFALVSPHK